jgi:NADH-quinone oxidoreductase subunit K
MNVNVLNVAVVAILGLLMVGFYGLMISRNLIKVVVALQILGKGAMLGLVLSGSVIGTVNIGQSMAVTVIVADTIIAVVALAMAVQIRKKFGTLEVWCLNNLNG